MFDAAAWHVAISYHRAGIFMTGLTAVREAAERMIRPCWKTFGTSFMTTVPMAKLRSG